MGLIPTLGALFPRGGPVQDPAFNCAKAPRRHSGDSRCSLFSPTCFARALCPLSKFARSVPQPQHIDLKNTCHRVLERCSRLQATKRMPQCQTLTVSIQHRQRLSLFHYSVTLLQNVFHSPVSLEQNLSAKHVNAKRGRFRTNTANVCRCFIILSPSKSNLFHYPVTLEQKLSAKKVDAARTLCILNAIAALVLLECKQPTSVQASTQLPSENREPLLSS